MDVDVPRIDRKHTLAALQQRVDGCSIGLCAAHKEMDFCLRHVARLADPVLCPFGIRVETIAARLLIVGLRQAAENLRQAAVIVVTLKRSSYHPFSPYIY